MNIQKKRKKDSNLNQSGHVHFLNELEHLYGDNVHILCNPFISTKLAQLSSKECTQPDFNSIVRELYDYILKEVICFEFPTEVRQITTRMSEFSKDASFSGKFLCKSVSVAIVNIIRAGIIPSQTCFDILNSVFDPSFIRQDHVMMSRVTNENGEVIDSKISGTKIGGDIDDSIVLFPDPMGATGGSISGVIDFYKKNISGNAKKNIIMTLIITPEFVRRIKKDHPDVIIYSLRLDRGGSSGDVLKSIPGTRWDEEVGLTEKQYIIPGAGGLGELMNNSYC